jgi:hypothetical protein
MAPKGQKRKEWFDAWGWFYLPCSWQGWMLCAIALGFCLQVTVLIYQSSQSVIYTLEGIFPYLICSFLLLDWIAARCVSKR